MKKYLTAILVGTLALALTGCGRWGIFGNEVDRWLSESESEDAYSYPAYSDDENDHYDDYDDYGDSAGSESSETYTGGLGETMSTCFFDYTVESVQLVDSYDGYTPADGNVLLDTVLTIQNTQSEELPMSIYDFQVQWGDFTEDEYGYEAEAFWDAQDTMQEHYTLAVGDSITTHVIYEVPQKSTSGYYVVCYLEEFADGTQGNLFGTVFSLDSVSGSASAATAAA
ncbi:MAG: DUF4352 domain-containing protein [Faecalibacterium sp.]|nr:DUF4352 domain-containing protein [Faecalibacterium sp.]